MGSEQFKPARAVPRTRVCRLGRDARWRVLQADAYRGARQVAVLHVSLETRSAIFKDSSFRGQR